VIWEGWCHDERHPVQSRFGERNRRHRAPEMERLLGVPSANASVGHGDIQKSKQPCVFFQRVALCGGNDLRNAVPVAGRRFGAAAVRPEQGDLGLLRCARGANSCAELLHLIVVSCVSLAIESRRARRSELRTAVHSKWHDEPPLRQQIGKKRRRRRDPHAGTAAAGGGTTALEPSLARAARIWFATNSPHEIPAVFCGPSGIPARIAACSASKVDILAGNKLTRAWCAAALAAASRDALAGTALSTR